MTKNLKNKQVKVTLIKSLNNATKTQKETARCLKLNKINTSQQFNDNPACRGQIKKIQHLLKLEEL